MENIFAILGNDQALIKREAEKMVRNVAGENADEFTLDICEVNDSVTPLDAIQETLNSINTPAFMGLVKTVWLKNFPFDLESPKTSKDPVAVAIRTLADLVSKGIPEDVRFIVSGFNVDSRKMFFKACKKSVKNLQILDQPKITDRDWQDRIRSIIKDMSAEKGLRLHPSAIEHLLNVFGVNTAQINNELEKIICYCGSDIVVHKDDIVDICFGSREAEFYAFGSALSARNLDASLIALHRLFSNSKDETSVSIGILAQAANAFRQMLQVKLFMSICRTNGHGMMGALKNLPQNKIERLRKVCPDVLAANPYAMKFKALDAEKFTGKEIINAIHILTDISIKSVSTNCSRRLLLEQAAITIVKQKL